MMFEVDPPGDIVEEIERIASQRGVEASTIRQAVYEALDGTDPHTSEQDRWAAALAFVKRGGDQSTTSIPNGEPAATAKSFTLLPSFDTTELGVARAFWSIKKADFKFVYERGMFFAWNGRVWEPDDTGVTRRAFQQFLSARINDDLVEAERRITDEDEHEKTASTLRHWLRWVESARGVRDGLYLLSNLHGVTIHERDLDAKPTVLTCENGTIDLVSGKLREPARDDLITRVLPFSYDPEAIPRHFLRFLSEVQPDGEIREYLQRCAGRCLIRNEERRRLIALYGVGANGKTVFLSAIGSVIEPYVVTADVTTLLERKYDRVENDLARMAGARMVVARELPGGRKFDDSVIKSITGGDKITARYLRREYFDFTPGFVLWTSTNYHPYLSDSPAMMDRITIIPWDVRVPPEKQDPALTGRLITERAGIFNWMLEGLRNWRLSGLTPPRVVLDYTHLVEEENLPFSAFVEQVLEKTSEQDRYVPVDWVHVAHAEWARRHDLPSLSSAWLGRRLGEIGIERERFGIENVGGYRRWAIRPTWVSVIRDEFKRHADRFVPQPTALDLDTGSMPDPAARKEGSRDVM